MVDYVKSTGTTGQMMIRDLGYQVQFFVTANNSTTYAYQMPWSIVINGANSGTLYHRYEAGSGWNLLTTQNVATSMNVTLNLGSTGTSGLGGPTSFTVYIQREATPPAPTTPVLSEINYTSMKAVFHSQGEGYPAPVLEWQLGYGTDPNNIHSYLTSTGTSTVTGLQPGTTYYFWARGRNASGWGAWSPRSVGTATLGYPGQLNAPVMSDVKQTSAVATFSSTDTTVTSYQVGWSTSPLSNPSTTVTATSPATITNLPPATTLYFRVRARNPGGWGQWSSATSIKTAAGAQIRVGAVMKDAVPYVKVSGVWRLATPYSKVLGEWKQSS